MKLIMIVPIVLSLLVSPVQAREFCPHPIAVAQHFGSYEGQVGFVSQFDLNDDGVITVGDIIIASNCWLDRRS